MAVTVSSRWRNRGIGSALLGELELRLRTLGVRRISAVRPRKTELATSADDRQDMRRIAVGGTGIYNGARGNGTAQVPPDVPNETDGNLVFNVVTG